MFSRERIEAVLATLALVGPGGRSAYQIIVDALHNTKTIVIACSDLSGDHPSARVRFRGKLYNFFPRREIVLEVQGQMISTSNCSSAAERIYSATGGRASSLLPFFNAFDRLRLQCLRLLRTKSVVLPRVRTSRKLPRRRRRRTKRRKA